MRDRKSISVWLMWIMASLFYAYQYILRVLPNIIMPELMEKYSVTAGAFGQFSGLYYLGYAGMHIPIGILLDRVGPRIIMPMSTFLAALGLLPLIFSESWAYPLLGRLLIGMGSSGAILGVFKVIRMGFEEKRFTVMLGISVTIGLLGAIYGGQPVNYLLNIMGWEKVLSVVAWVGLFLGIAMYFLIPPLSSSESASNSLWQDIKTVLSTRVVFVICILSGLMVGPLEGFPDAWGTEFLKKAYGLSDAMASTLPSLIFFGMCFGAPILSYIAEKTNAYYNLTILSALVMGGSFVLILLGLAPPPFLHILLFLSGFMCAYQILVIYKATTYVSESLLGLTTAIVNMIIMTFGYVFHRSIGGLMDNLWDGQITNGVPIYSYEAFAGSLSIIPIGLGIAMIGFMVLHIREKKNKL